MVVVHPGCYRRDLYENDDMPDDEPWFCDRCKYIIEADEKQPPKAKPV